VRRWPSGAVLIAAAVLGAGVFLLRREPPVEAGPRANREPSVAVLPPPPSEQELKPTEIPAPASSAAPSTPVAAPFTRAVAPALPKPGFVSGTVTVAGGSPRRKPIRMDADPACAALHAEQVLSDTLVRDAENRARWAFVRVKAGLEGRTFAPPALPVMLAQVGCRFEPHVLGVQVGQPLVIVNQDPLLHNIHAHSFVNHAFNFAQPLRGLEETKTFTAPEMIPIRCDVHPWMSAWVAVVEHPYYAVTDGMGAYALPALPPGRYLVEAWHEACEAVSKEIEVTAGDAIVLDFVLDVRK
jgi:hypothetical protein